MKEKILKRVLLFLSGLCVVFAVIYVINYYNEVEEQKNRLLTIEKTLEVEDIGTNVKLELNSKNKEEKVTYEVKDPSIVTVSESGNLVSVGEGTTTVTVTNKEKTKSQTFVVSVGEEAIEDINKNDEKVDQLINENKDSLDVSNKSETNVNDNSNKNNTETNTNNTPNQTKPTTIKVTGITLNKSSETVYINNTKSINLVATIKPSNATNKSVTWSTSNSNVATVNKGIVSIKNPGVVTISAKSVDGNKVASMTLTVKKRIVFVIGASQVTMMVKYKQSYLSSKYNYNTSDGTLVYVEKSGSGIPWQTNEGMTKTKNIINTYKNVKSQVELFVYFPLVGNTIQYFVCGNESTSGSLGKISTSNSNIQQYAKNYNDAIQSLKNSGYNVKGYVVSMHPVVVSQSTSNYVVVNQNANACKYKYRSNWKYFKFNTAMKSIVDSNYSKNLKYLSLFSRIMQTNSEQKNFSYKITYNTTDGLHWDSATTKTYVDMMLDYTNEL